MRLTPSRIRDLAKLCHEYVSNQGVGGASQYLDLAGLKGVARQRVLLALSELDDETGLDADKGRLALPKPARKTQTPRKPIARKVRPPSKAKVKRLKKRLHAKAWYWFSRWVRMSAADPDGLAPCYTCGARKPWQEMNASHLFHGRADFNVLNVRAACIRCNLHMHGNLGAFAARTIREHGLEAWEQLQRDANATAGYEVTELEAVIEKYKALFEALETK